MKVCLGVHKIAECRPRVLQSRINEDEGLIKAAEKACKN